VDPVERSTRMRAAGFPAKNSAAVREASADGAGGNMSAWKESACAWSVNLWDIGKGMEKYVLSGGR